MPIAFFERFPGMTRPVAEFLATCVFCVLRAPDCDDGARVGAREFGRWARGLLALLLEDQTRRTWGLTQDEEEVVVVVVGRVSHFALKWLRLTFCETKRMADTIHVAG